MFQLVRRTAAEHHLWLCSTVLMAHGSTPEGAAPVSGVAAAQAPRPRAAPHQHPRCYPRQGMAKWRPPAAAVVNRAAVKTLPGCVQFEVLQQAASRVAVRAAWPCGGFPASCGASALPPARQEHLLLSTVHIPMISLHTHCFFHTTDLTRLR